MTKISDQDWLEMKSIRRRKYGDAVWIPLHVEEKIESQGEFGYLGFREEYLGVCSLAVPIDHRVEADQIEWTELAHGNHGSYATPNWYKQAEIYQRRDGEYFGTELVLVQTFPDKSIPQWHINQDLLFALGLKREGDIWICPDENYCDVIKLRRNKDQCPISVEIRTEFLRDYLAARQMALLILSYRNRDAVLSDAKHIEWPDGNLREQEGDDRFEGRVWEILEGGDPVGSDFAVLHMWRTDVDPDVDVPSFGDPTDENVGSHSWTGKRTGTRLRRVEGEIWRKEWIEPGVQSLRVRRDKIPSGIQYIIDASGTQTNSENLDNEDIGRYLWFQAGVIDALINRRGGALRWHTCHTGSVSCSPGYGTHFGINSADLITVYAYDIAKLPHWQQRIWAGFNISPEGKVSDELLSAQMQARPAQTTAPEKVLLYAFEKLDSGFAIRFGSPLFIPHPSTVEIMNNCHRFRGINAVGVFALAKDLARLTADRIDLAVLHRILPPPKETKWRELKSLEKVLATIIGADVARSIMGPLFGTYDLRLGDAHLASHDIDDAFRRANVDREQPPLRQAFQLLCSIVTTIENIAHILKKQSES